ncbi:hypothetical protein [Leptospira ryugenii]|nr:hypothetical protein [Leptospira ryugenii]
MKLLRHMSILLLFCSLSLPMQAREVPSGGEMLIDLAIARPVGFAGTVLGTGALLISTPFTLLSGTWTQSMRRLVLYPAKFTFTRGLGEFPGYMEEYATVED